MIRVDVETFIVGLAAAFVALFLPLPAGAITEVETENTRFEVVGAGRLTGAFLHFDEDAPVDEDDALAASVLRLMTDGEFGSVADFELNLFADLSRAPITAGSVGAFGTAGTTRSAYRTGHLEWSYWKGGAVDGRIGLDRAFVSFDWYPWRLSAGRMPINESVTGVFAVNDLFAPFSSTAVNTLYKPGVDAVRLSFAPGMLSTIDLFYVQGWDDDNGPSWSQSAALVSLRTTVWNKTLSLFGGKVAKELISGVSFQGGAGPLGLRAEGHAGFPDEGGRFSPTDRDEDGRFRDDLFARLAVGADLSLPARGAYFALEYMYQSDGARDPSGYLSRATSLPPDALGFLGRHYLGGTAGIDVTPLLRGQALVIWNAEDSSGVGMVSLVYSIADEADAVLGALVGWGSSSPSGPQAFELRSEYGSAPAAIFCESRFFF